MKNRLKRLYEHLERTKQRYSLADRVDTYLKCSRDTDLELEKEVRKTDLHFDDRIFEQYARIGGELSAFLTAIAIVEGRYD